MSWWYGRRYKSVGERAAEARAKIKKLRKKIPNLNPIQIEGNKIAKTWWGKAWNDNLNHYADQEYRIGRGRSYVKNGMVVHLEIKPGHIEALVMGSRTAPYKVSVKIDKISKNKWNSIKRLSKQHLHSLTELFTGKFPKELADVFSNKSGGVFPTLKEMSFGCSCPDWASMCKHVSASLFAVGAQLDEKPGLIFELRGTRVDELVQSAIIGETQWLRSKTAVRAKNRLSLTDKKLASLFDINLVTPKKRNRVGLGESAP